MLLFIILISLASCDNGGTDKNVSAKAVADSSGKVAQCGIKPGYLDTLYMDTAAFMALQDKEKLVFSFVFEKPDSLTMYGWSTIKDSTYKPDPNVKLKIGKPDTTAICGSGVFFGNEILHKMQIKKIQNLLSKPGNKDKFVLFAPHISLTGQITYSILLSRDDPKSFVKIHQYTDPGEDLNPSPPKNF